MTLGEARRTIGPLWTQLELMFTKSGLLWQREECTRTDEQAAINSMGEARRHTLALLSAATEPALAVALTNNGRVKSPLMTVHRFGLAQDYSLFRVNTWVGGKPASVTYLSDTESHREFGEWWEKQHPLCRWGGRFNDGGHYSFAWNGVR